jgi:hypothetical protein
MSPHHNAEVIRARQLEIAASAAHAHHGHELRTMVDRPRRVSVRLRAAGIALGVCLAVAGTGVATASAGTSQRLTPGQLQYHIRSLEADGYVPSSCRVGSTRLFNPRTHRYATVNW